MRLKFKPVGGGGGGVNGGDAAAGDVLQGKTFYAGDNELKTGTLALTGDAAADDVLKGKSFYSTDPKTKNTGTLELTGDVTEAEVPAGKTFYTTDPKTKQTGTAPTQSAKTWTPKTTSQTIPAGTYLVGKQTILGDADLKAENIKTGVNIFGVTGTGAMLSVAEEIMNKVSYTGKMKKSVRFMDGVPYVLFILESSGTLTVEEEMTGDVWMCGGGGRIYYNNSACGGAGGGYTTNVFGTTIVSGAVVVGSGGGATSYNGSTANGGATSTGNAGTAGGSGGGGSCWSSTVYGVGAGQGSSTRPFLSDDMEPQCGGGGAIGYTSNITSWAGNGGAGGSDGSNGGKASAEVGTSYGGAGGACGGGGGGGTFYDTSQSFQVYSVGGKNGSDGAGTYGGAGGGFGYGGGDGGCLNKNVAGTNYAHTYQYSKGTPGAVMIRIAI